MNDLSPQDIEAGFVRPLRTSVLHTFCGGMPSIMKPQQAFDMARDPQSWTTCWCVTCGRRLPADQFNWPDGAKVGT